MYIEEWAMEVKHKLLVESFNLLIPLSGFKHISWASLLHLVMIGVDVIKFQHLSLRLEFRSKVRFLKAIREINSKK